MFLVLLLLLLFSVSDLYGHVKPASQPPLTKGRRIKVRKIAKEGNKVHSASDI